MDDLGAYLGEFSAALAPSVTTLAPGVAQRLLTLPVTTAYQDALEDARMWAWDARWYAPERYRDASVCFRQPTFGGGWVTEGPDFLPSSGYVCDGWSGNNGQSGIRLLMPMTYWSIPCDDAGPKNAFQYERYRWAQDRITKRMASVPTDATQKLTWLGEVTGLLEAAAVATNVRTDGDFHRRLFGVEPPSPPVAVGMLQASYPFSAYDAAGVAGTKLKFLRPAGRDTNKLFPVVPVGLSKSGFCPSLKMADPIHDTLQGRSWSAPQASTTTAYPDYVRAAPPGYPSNTAFRASEFLARLTPADKVVLRDTLGFGLEDRQEAVRRWDAAGRGRATIQVALSYGTVSFVSLDYYMNEAFAACDRVLSKNYFDWIKVALEYYKDRMTSFYGGDLSVSQAESLRLITEGISLTATTQASISSSGAWSSLSTVLSLVTLVAGAVNAAVGAVVAAVSTLLVAGLQELSKATGYGVVEGLQAKDNIWPPFVRILEEPCRMPVSEADLVPRASGLTITPAMRTILRDASTLQRNAGLIKAALPRCPAGTTGTYPNCIAPPKKSSPLVWGFGALILFAALTRK